MSLFIVWDGQPIPVEREIVESDRSFALRLEFFLYALDQGLSVERARVLSYCFSNQRLYGSRYMPAIEAQIATINSSSLDPTNR